MRSRLSQLQAVTTHASLFLSLGFLIPSTSPQLAWASEPPIDNGILLDTSAQSGAGLALSYEPEFALFDRSIIGRAEYEVVPLSNNDPEKLNIGPGETMCFLLRGSPTSGGSERKREVANNTGDTDSDGDGQDDNESPVRRQQDSSTRRVFVSANTCIQPRRVSADSTTPDPPRLTLSVADTEEVGCPKTHNDLEQGSMAVFDEGAASMSINATGDVYIGITAPSISTDFDGLWNFEVAASLNEYYHSYGENVGGLMLMDSDSSSMLLVSRDLTDNHAEDQTFMDQDMPYEVFVESEKSQSMKGLRRSACGMEQKADMWANGAGNGRNNRNVRMELTTRGGAGFLKQQFYFDGLNASSAYSVVLFQRGNDKTKRQDEGAAGGGGLIFEPTVFQTSTGNSSCRVVTDLEFCSDVGYSIPGNVELFNNTELARRYDDYARTMYEGFEKVMQQVACEAEPTERYSLARSCDDCAAAYKRWLCAVSIPRCEDLSSSNRFAVTRNLGQDFPNGTSLSDEDRDPLTWDLATDKSRNAFIDEEIKPGPYKELLPCEDICYEVVQSCPAVIGFQCPQPGLIGFDVSYGRRQSDGTAGNSCNAGGARTQVGAASLVSPGRSLVLAGTLVAAVGVFFA